MEAREYFEKEYGHEHIEMVVEMKDWVSLYGLMDEFAEWKVKNCSIPAVIKSVCDQCRFENECRFKAENIEQNCKFFINKQTFL